MKRGVATGVSVHFHRESEAIALGFQMDDEQYKVSIGARSWLYIIAKVANELARRR